MAAPDPKPIKLTRGANPTPGTDPQPFVVVEGLQAAAQANSTATDVAGIVADFNALLAKLRAAGILAP